MITILVIGDPHFKITNYFESDEFVNKCILYINNLEIKPDIIIVLGDILDRHEKIHVVPLSKSIEFFIQLSHISPLYVLIGNHDRPNNSDFLSGYHPFNGLKLVNNITIVDTTLYLKFNGFNFIMVPYVFPGRFQEALDIIKDQYEDINNIDCIFAHQEFYGAKMGAIISQIGDKWDLDNPLVISGHIHDYNVPQKNIIYIGTPMQHAFGDTHHKTISMFTFNKISDKELIENPIDKNGNPTIYQKQNNLLYKETRIDLKLTKRIICHVPAKQISNWVPPEGYLIKLIIDGTGSELKAIMKLQLIKELSKRKNIKIAYKNIDDPNLLLSSNYNKEIILPYGQKLKGEIEDKPGPKSWFDELFVNAQL